MTERQKKDVAQKYYRNYVALTWRFRDAKTAAENESFPNLDWAVTDLSAQYNQFIGKFNMLCDLHMGVKVGADGEAVLINFEELSDDERSEALAEFYEKKIILEGGENNG